MPVAFLHRLINEICERLRAQSLAARKGLPIKRQEKTGLKSSAKIVTQAVVIVAAAVVAAVTPDQTDWQI